MEFAAERDDYLTSIRRLERETQLLQGLLERTVMLVRRDCNYSNLERLRKEAVWDEESGGWRLPEVLVQKTALPAGETAAAAARPGPCDMFVSGELGITGYLVMDKGFLTLSSASISSQQLLQTPRTQELGLGPSRAVPGTHVLTFLMCMTEFVMLEPSAICKRIFCNFYFTSGPENYKQEPKKYNVGRQYHMTI